MQKTTLYLTEDIQRDLKDVARRTGRTEAELVREALTLYLGQQARPWPKSIGSASVPGVDARDTEEFLRANWRPR